jgi:DNA-binding NarL/FixJ family response regulator
MSAKLLLVDDEPGVRESVQAYLEDSGYQVQVASNAKDAWDWLQHNQPDLVISDLMMPQVDGYQFLKQLREDPKFVAMPVVFLTARGMKSDRITGYQAGCDAYISKPFDPEELIAIVQNVLQRRATVTNSNNNPEVEGIAKQIAAELKGMFGNGSNSSGSAIVTTPPPINIDFTPREQSVLDLVSAGLMNKEIARQLETSVRNVEKYVSRLFGKTGTNSRTELVRYALEHGLTK